MPSHVKRQGGGGVGRDSNSNPTHVLLHPSQIPRSHYTTSAHGSMMSSGFTEPYQDYEGYASELDSNSRSTSSSFSRARSRSRPSSPLGLGHKRNDSDYGNAYGVDLGGWLSSSSSSSSLSGLPVISRERLGRAGLRRLDMNGFRPRRRKGMGFWKLLVRVLGGLGLVWVAFKLVKIGASQVRIIYSHWMHIPIELLDVCKDAKWTYHPPTLLTTDLSVGASFISQLYSASTFFEIPADEPLHLLSQGNFSYGTVEFLPVTSESILRDVEWSENGQRDLREAREQKIRVEVYAEYRNPSVFNWARICMIGGESMEDGTQGAEAPASHTGGEPVKDSILSRVGIMIWTPETSTVTPKEHQLHLTIKVYIPPRLASRYEYKPWLPSIVTDLPTFEHKIGDLAPTVEFQKFDAKTQRSILVKSLRAESISLQTVNKTIAGAMEAWSLIRVETFNAGLDVNATLAPAPAHLHAKYTELLLKTSNAPLKSTVTLRADPRIPSQNVFQVTTKTSNGPLIVVFNPIPSPTHTGRSVDDPHLALYVQEYDLSNVRPRSEQATSKPAKDSSAFLEDSGSGGKNNARSDPQVLASEDFVSTSSFSSSRSSSSSSSLWPILRFDGYTTYGPAYVDLPPTFVGHFTLRTSNRHQPHVYTKRGGSDEDPENTDGAGLVREITSEVLEGGEVIKGAVRLVPAGSKKLKSSEKDLMGIDASSKESEGEGLPQTPDVLSSKSRTTDGTVDVPIAWANVWTTNDHVELWV